MEVRHGVLLNVHGIPARGGIYTFMPAIVELEGGSGRSEHPLRDWSGGKLPPALRHPVGHGFDAAWVRARIPSVFGFTPEPAEAEKSLLDLGFAAVIVDRSVCYPFRCMDHYGKTALIFSDKGPDEAVKQPIADDFWEVLTRHPDELTDFEQRLYHSGALIWLTYGCRSGHVYLDESREVR